MTRVVLRRSTDSAASSTEAATIVAAHNGIVIDKGDRTMLVDVALKTEIASLRGQLPGWIVAEQGTAKIPVPDARLKVRSSD